MDKSVQHLADIQVPAADPAIDRAMAELDCQLAAWTHVLDEAQARLRQLLPATTISQPVTANTCPPTESTCPLPPETVTPANEPPISAQPARTPTANNRVDGLTEDDQAVLATLDPQVAQTISIMRRLTPVKRSVRDVLREYEATHTVPKTDRPAKQSWFARRK